MISRILVSIFLVLAGASAAFAGDKTLIVLDASGSMWGQIDGKPKFQIAQEALRGVLADLPADREIGLMAYGHRQKGACDDIELIVPPAAGAAATVAIAADALQFIGKTPLSAAVKQAAETLKYTEDKATVVLITDGLETCDADPCALGTELEASGVDFTAHVVGFGLTAEEGKQVACLAENTGGKYIQATDAEALGTALAATVAAAPEPEPAPAPQPEPAPAPATLEFNFIPELVLSETSEPMKDAGNAYEVYAVAADGTKGERLTVEYGNYKGSLAPGDYIVRAEYDAASVERKVSIAADRLDTTQFNLNAGILLLHPRPSEGADIDAGAAVVIKFPSGDARTYYGDIKLVAPAGEQDVTVKIGQGSVNEKLTLKAGDKLEKDIIAGVGRVVMNAFYTEGGDRVDNSGLAFEVYKAKKKIDGSRERLLTTYGPDAKDDLPAGDYVIKAEMDQAAAELPFSIKVGDFFEANVVLNAGVLAISAPGAKELQIFGAKKDIEGNRPAFGHEYSATWQATLSAGDYVIVATRGDTDAKSEATVTVTAGERTELTVP